MLTTPVEQAQALPRIGGRLSEEDVWPAPAWSDYVAAGVLRWTIPKDCGGAEFSPADVLAGCIELARFDLAPAFILSQFQSAGTRLASTENLSARNRWLSQMAHGAMATVGLSHLTTSRQHAARPAVLAEVTPGGFRVTGEIPWVTGGGRADVIAAGASLEDGRQILFAVPRDRPGLTVLPHWRLLALTGSETGPLQLDQVDIHHDEILAGPVEKVMRMGATGGAGSLTTSALALGHAFHAIDRLAAEAVGRSALDEIVEAYRVDADHLREALLRSASDRGHNHETPEELRRRTTALAVAASQGLLTATKGAGFVAGHPAERLVRESMFFLVWSCPQAVSSRLLREFSGCEG